MRRDRIIAAIGALIAIAVCAGVWPDVRPPDRERATAPSVTRYPHKPRVPELPDLPAVPDPAIGAIADAAMLADPDTDDTAAVAYGYVTVRVYVPGRSPSLRMVLSAFSDCPVIARLGYEQVDGGVRVPVQPGDCHLQARRRDGALLAWTNAIDVDVRAGDEHEFELYFPTERTGGLGVAIAEDDYGVLVTEVHANTPAARAGLKTGDVVVEVDGLPAATLTLPEFQQVMTGPEGTEVTFVVQHEGDPEDEGSYTIRREHLSEGPNGEIIGDSPAVR